MHKSHILAEHTITIGLFKVLVIKMTNLNVSIKQGLHGRVQYSKRARLKRPKFKYSHVVLITGFFRLDTSVHNIIINALS